MKSNLNCFKRGRVLCTCIKWCRNYQTWFEGQILSSRNYPGIIFLVQVTPEVVQCDLMFHWGLKFRRNKAQNSEFLTQRDRNENNLLILWHDGVLYLSGFLA